MKAVDCPQFLLKPGYVFLPAQPTQISSVLGSAVGVTLYDRRLKMGGMAAFLEPLRPNKNFSTTLFACPAIVGLLKMFKDLGSNVVNLESQIFGGAEREDAPWFEKGLGRKNYEAAMEILELEGVWISSQDLGGIRGRKINFNTHSGEVLVAKVNHLRKEDWYRSASA